MAVIKQPFTNVQLEILKAFSYNLTAKELEEFRELLAAFFAERLVSKVNAAIEEKGVSETDLDAWLDEDKIDKD